MVLSEIHTTVVSDVCFLMFWLGLNKQFLCLGQPDPTYKIVPTLKFFSFHRLQQKLSVAFPEKNIYMYI
jgi:hypothetical protein